ncbi:YgcG family protein [Pseudomonas sp. ADAK18]|uniref:TPM domain-containing protein n=1 Tax=Pseudomonas sp. ADAK18 TaxID=2730848 RepID=UPI001463D156|nr:YgcG family protein [Pseudomonas sp. ADAK18]QJI32694.1 YgcG family protein [Pseudomonas sp. ADAK18]
MVIFLRQCALCVLVAFLASWGLMAQADSVPSGLDKVVLDQRVIDLTNTLDSTTKAQLIAQLAALEQRKGSQIAVLLVPGTDGASIEEFANHWFRTWKLGRKGIDDGILLLVVKDERKVRIEVGYGLEGAVTDLLANRIIEEHIKPAFRQDDYAGGVQRGVNDLVLLVDGETLPQDAPWSWTPEAYTLFLALILGAVGGVLVSARKLHWRGALATLAVVTTTLTLVAVIGGREWAIYPLAVPFLMLMSGALFGALWLARTVFYMVLGLLSYSTGLLLTNHYVRELSFIYWLVLPLAGLVVLGLYLLLFVLMKTAWSQSRVAFFIQLAVVAAVYAVAGFVLDEGLNGWLLAFPMSSCAALVIFGNVAGGSDSGGSGSSGSSSSSSSDGGFSGGGGSSGGGGASGSW